MCNCPPGSPFHWHERNAPSLFAKDAQAQVQGASGLSKSLKSTLAVEKQKKAGKIVSTIRGISRNKEAETLRLRDFMVYSRARKNDIGGVEVQENGNVAA